MIFGVVRSGATADGPFAVGAYIAGAYWFTSSTSFANPAVTVGPHALRHLRRDRPRLGAAFVVAQGRRALASPSACLRYPDSPTDPPHPPAPQEPGSTV